jgi:hypothetical protein
MKGTYRFYQDGKMIAEQENLITTEGKKAILRYLAGHSGGFVRSLAVGTGTTAAALTDTKLVFEVARAGVSVISPDYVTQKLVFKGTLPQETEFAIWEIGALSVSEIETYGKLLLSFDAETESWSAGAFQVNTSRVGADALRINAALSTTTTSTLTDIFLDTADFNDNDKFTMAYIPLDANLNSLKIRFKTDATNYFEYTFAGIASAAYRTESWTKAQMVKTGVPSWDSITSIDLIVNAKAAGATNVDFDALRIDSSVVPNTEYALVSRTVLGAAVIKTDVSQMDIEYTVDVTI